MRDQDAMRALSAAVAALADDPYPPEGFHRGRYHRLRVGRYRVVYVVDAGQITVERVDRVSDLPVCSVVTISSGAVPLWIPGRCRQLAAARSRRGGS
jgi:hypothetical protein